jgi:hypothetical protein
MKTKHKILFAKFISKIIAFIYKNKKINILDIGCNVELAPYLYPEFGYNVEKLLKLLKQYNYRFYDAKDFNEIFNINEYANKIKDGSSENIFLK